MKVKTYRAPTLKEALEKVKRDLGPDAFILGQKEVKPSNLLGFVQNARVEVTAAVDYSNASESARPPSAKTPQGTAPAYDGNPDSVRDRLRISNSITMTRPPADSPSNGAVLDEIRKLNTVIRSFSHDRRAPVVWLKPRRFSTPTSKDLYARLVGRGIDEGLAASLVSTPNASEKSVASTLAERVRIYGNLIPDTAAEKTRVVAFVGPTGVGKTTTIAKIAANAAFQKNLKVGMVTLDNFRIGAVEQLRTYGDIMGIPLQVAASAKQLPEAIESLADRDLVLIDTTGRNHREVHQEWELASVLNGCETITKALVVSATTNGQDLADVVDRYEIYDPSCLIFTKLDETSMRGAVVNEMIRSGKPLAYFTMGQSVPDDIFKPSAGQLVDLTVGYKDEEAWPSLIHAARQVHKPRSASQSTRRQALEC